MIQDIFVRRAIREKFQDDQQIAATAQNHRKGKKKQENIAEKNSGNSRKSAKYEDGHHTSEDVVKLCECLHATAVGRKLLPDDAEFDGMKMVFGNNSPCEAVNQFMDNNADYKKDGEQNRFSGRIMPQGAV